MTLRIRPGIALLCALAAAGSVPALAQGRAVSPETLEIVEARQNLMARLLDAVNRIAPRLGSGAAAVNPSHWRTIGENADTVDALLRESRAMWPPGSNLRWGAASRAMPGLWTLPEAFERHYDAADSALPGLRGAIAREDAAAAREGFCQLVAACGSCHGAFRKIDTMSLYREGPHWLGRYPGCVPAE